MDIVKPKTPRSINCISIHKDQANPNSKGKKSKGGCVTVSQEIYILFCGRNVKSGSDFISTVLMLTYAALSVVANRKFYLEGGGSYCSN